MKSLLPLVLLLLLCSPVHTADTPPLPTSHTHRQIEGWTVRIDDRLLDPAHLALGERALKLLTARLVAIDVVVPENILAKLREVPIQLDLGL